MSVKPRRIAKNVAEYKSVELAEVKVEADGTFTGYASLFGVEDKQGDIVQPGAFTKTLSENGGLFVLLDQHDFKAEIGLVEVEQDAKGLRIKRGQFYIDPGGDRKNEVQAARDVYVKMKRRHEAGKPLQFSIGYRAINPKYERGKRLLTEIALGEISTVTFPALPEAVTESVKSAKARSFQEALERLQASRNFWRELSDIKDALYQALDDAIFDDLSADARFEHLQQSAEQFQSSLLEWASRHYSADDARGPAMVDEIASLADALTERAATKQQVSASLEAAEQLVSVLTEHSAVTDKEPHKHSDSADSEGPRTKDEPRKHSLLNEMKRFKLKHDVEEMKRQVRQTIN